jgi:hypothetical protein
VFELHVLGHGALSAIGLFAANNLADILALDLIGAPSHSFLLLVSVLLGELLEGGDEVGQLPLVLEGSPQLQTQLAVAGRQLADLTRVEFKSDLDVALETGDVHKGIVGAGGCPRSIAHFLVYDARNDDDVALCSFLYRCLTHIII